MALREPEMEMTFAEAVHAALVELGWRPRSLFSRYDLAGGQLSQSTIDNYIAGTSTPQIDDYNILAGVLNAAMGEERFPRLPFRPKWVARESNPEPTDRQSVAPEIRLVA